MTIKKYDSIEQIIAIGVLLTKQKREIEANLFDLNLQAEKYFPCKEFHEAIKTSDGIVTREVENEWFVKGDDLCKVQIAVPGDIEEYLTVPDRYHTTARLRALVCDKESEIGKKLRDVVVKIDQTVKISFAGILSSTKIAEVQDGSTV